MHWSERPGKLMMLSFRDSLNVNLLSCRPPRAIRFIISLDRARLMVSFPGRRAAGSSDRASLRSCPFRDLLHPPGRQISSPLIHSDYTECSHTAVKWLKILKSYKTKQLFSRELNPRKAASKTNDYIHLGQAAGVFEA